MPKEIILSKDSDPKSPKYLVWNMDEQESYAIKAAIGAAEDDFLLLSTLSDYYEDFECPPDRLLSLCQETTDLQMTLEESHRETPSLIKVLTLIGGLAAMAHDQELRVFGYAG
jgi:hypothetical protein